jgi:hypothetical protein
MGNDNTDYSNRTVNRINKVYWETEHIEKLFQKLFEPGIDIAIDESTVGFKAK